ncbi:hypothetical protein KJ742_05535 [Patescibacteria group bacterium]|nr:hypothetical protein [Patescibacteria group bacterium]MBU1683379.1 hypothetical protein [Patescibacteria group bacterium]MBU1935535.1 hypothetical protein [Patescibacteria group bacterium]
MKFKNIISLKVFVLLGISLSLLTSCGVKESPEQVIENFKQQISEVQSAVITSEVVMTGVDDEDSVDFTADIDFQFDRSDETNRKSDINVVMGGMMTAADKVLEGDLDFNIRTLGENYYVQLNELESSDETIQSIQPFLAIYIGKWLHIADDFIPENIRELQQKSEETLTKEAQVKELFITTNLFDVTKDYGVETINGKKVYHFGVQFNEAGIQDYIRKAAVIDGRELTEAEVAEASKIASYITDAQLWIGTKDYYLYKASASMTGGAIQSNVDMNIDIVIEAANYNKSINIEAPEDAQEFNPLELLMGFSTATMDMNDGLVEDDLGEVVE